jgi:hypothetical protein
MIILSNTTDSLQVVLASAVTTNQLRCYVAYRDTTATTITPNRAVATTNNTTPVTLLSAPSASAQKIVDYLSIYNSDTANAVVTVYINSSSTTYKLTETTLGPGEKLEFQEGQGFRSLATDGSLKIGENQSITSNGNVNVASISTGITTTTTTYSNMTGLSFSMDANSTYWFRFVISTFHANASVSYRFAVNSAATLTYLSYMRLFNVGTGPNNLTTYISKDYDSSEAATGNTVTAGTIATMEGIISVSTSGTLIGRMAQELASGTMNVRAGSLVYYQKLS